MKLNINTATKQQIVEIPGFGDSVAGRIVQYRDEHGPFHSFEEFTNIQGLGEKKIQILRNNCTLGSKTGSTKVTVHAHRSDVRSQPKNVRKPFSKVDTTRNQSRLSETPSSSEKETVNTSYNPRPKADTVTLQNVNPLPMERAIKKEPSSELVKPHLPNLNLATIDEISFVPGISEEMAIRIVNYRDNYGSFSNFEHLKSIHGIGESKLQILKKYFSIPLVKSIGSQNKTSKAIDSDVNDLLPHVRTIVDPSLICKDTTVSQFERLVGGNKLLFLHINIQGLINKFDELSSLVSSMTHNPDVICISEKNNPKKLKDVELPGYKFYQKNSTQQIGGVGMYVKKTHRHRERLDLQFDISDCENVWIEIINSKTPNIVVGAVYRHPRRNFGEFQKCLMKNVKKIQEEEKLFYILGDININMRDSRAEVRSYCDLLKTNGCKLVIAKPTSRRVTRSGDSITLIDHIYTNNGEGKTESGVITDSDISDHCPVYCIVNE